MLISRRTVNCRSTTWETVCCFVAGRARGTMSSSGTTTSARMKCRACLGIRHEDQRLRHTVAACDVSFPLRVGFDEHPLYAAMGVCPCSVRDPAMRWRSALSRRKDALRIPAFARRGTTRLRFIHPSSTQRPRRSRTVVEDSLSQVPSISSARQSVHPGLQLEPQVGSELAAVTAQGLA
jgi:hypothetical protein